MLHFFDDVQVMLGQNVGANDGNGLFRCVPEPSLYFPVRLPRGLFGLSVRLDSSVDYVPAQSYKDGVSLGWSSDSRACPCIDGGADDDISHRTLQTTSLGNETPGENGHVPFWARHMEQGMGREPSNASATWAQGTDHGAIRILQGAAWSMDLLEDITGWRHYIWHKRWQFLRNGADSYLACHLTVMLLATLSMIGGMVRAMACKRSRRHINGVAIRPRSYFCILLAFSLCSTGEVAPGNEDGNRNPSWRRPPAIEVWRSGLPTLEEQMQQAYQRFIAEMPVERLSREAPPPDFAVDIEEADIGAGVWLEDERPTTHISIWIAAPFYTAESLDVAMNFPLTAVRLEDMIREELRIIPESMSSLVPTSPQPSDDFASYIAAPLAGVHWKKVYCG